MNLSVIGIGYVGLVSGVCFAEKGNNVICIDSDEEKIYGLTKGILPIYEEGLEKLCNKNYRNGNIQFTTDLKYGIQNSDIIFIAVGTPSLATGQADLSQVEEVAYEIARHMNGYKIIVNKSTVPVGTQKLVTKIINENQSRKIDFDVVSNPEFLREGTAVYDTMNAERIVIGSESKKATEVLKQLHEPFNAPIFVAEPESSEMIKYAANAFLATKISFINEIANICEKVGANVDNVAEGIGLDSRISPQFLNAGIGFGGACFPKDAKALVKIGELVGYVPKIVQSTLEVNAQQRLKPIQLLSRSLGEIKDRTIAILGLAFKPKTDDVRDAPSICIINRIKELGGHIKAYDPVAMENAQELISDAEFCDDAYEAVKNADAAILVTEWGEFKELDLTKIKNIMAQPIFVDCRNLFQPEEMIKLGFCYYCIGKKDSRYNNY